MERLEKMYDIISKMDFFNQRAARELWSQKPEKIQNQDIFNRHQDLCEIKEFVDDVAELMELEEQGLLLKLPCKVGDTIYLLDYEERKMDEATVDEIMIDSEGLFINTDYASYLHTKLEYVFLTKEEAEAKLKELENE